VQQYKSITANFEWVFNTDQFYVESFIRHHPSEAGSNQSKVAEGENRHLRQAQNVKEHFRSAINRK
jgi:hypothetical protein